MHERPHLRTVEAALRLTLSQLESTEEETLILLRGHLLVEAMLWADLQRALPKADALSESGLSFRQLVGVVASLHPDSKYEWLWPALYKLNVLRNELAHSLLAGDFAAKRAALFRATEGHIETEGLEGPALLRRVLLLLCGIVFNLKP